MYHHYYFDRRPEESRSQFQITPCIVPITLVFLTVRQRYAVTEGLSSVYDVWNHP